MSIISVVNLKGGVGKTAVAINAAHALSKRFCETLVVDLDGQGDASRLLCPDQYATTPWEANLGAREIEAPSATSEVASNGTSRIERILQYCRENIIEVRPNLSLLPLKALLNFLPSQAQQGSSNPQSGEAGRDLGGFGPLLAKIIYEIGFQYDHVIVDTPPSWSGIHESLLPITDLSLIPVDPSEMSVRAAIQLLNQANFHSPVCSLLIRTLVSKKATSIAKLAEKKLQGEFLSESGEKADSMHPPKRVMLRGVSSMKGRPEIYLSNTPIYRSELVHKLTYLKKTVFESKDLELLQNSYIQLAKDIEKVLADGSPQSDDGDENTFQFAFA